MKDLAFQFAPPAGWERLDTAKLDLPSSLAFKHENPSLIFCILAEKKGPKSKSDLASLSALAKSTMQHLAPKATFDEEERLSKRELNITRFEGTATVRGEHRFYVYWVTAYRDYGYQLTCSGPLRERETVRNEMEALIPRFEILEPTGEAR